MSSLRDSDPGPPAQQASILKSTEPTKMPIMKSEAEVLLSQISTNISEFYVKMSGANAETKTSCLSAVSQILHQLGCLVATKLSSSDVSIKSNIYNLYFNDEELSMSQDEESVLSMSQDEETVLSTSHDEETVQSKSNNSMSENGFSTLLSTISSVAPSNIYDRKKAARKRSKRRRKKICPELYSIWSNAATIVTPVINSMQSTSSFPCVEWKSVNKSFLTNIPTPSSIPIHGCSPNPDDYKDVYKPSDYGGMQNVGSKFTSEFPFGKALGFLTSAGLINVPDEVFHGYIFDAQQGWILHARYPEDQERVKKVKKMERRKRG